MSLLLIIIVICCCSVLVVATTDIVVGTWVWWLRWHRSDRVDLGDRVAVQVEVGSAMAGNFDDIIRDVLAAKVSRLYLFHNLHLSSVIRTC
jgi:hypothetical protein